MRFKTLRAKFLFFSVGGTIVFALIISFMVHWNYRENLKSELQRRAEILSQGLSTGVQKAVLTDNMAQIRQVVTQYKLLDEDIVYIFLTDPDGNIIYHTFDIGFPQDLLLVTDSSEKTVSLETELGPIENVRRGIVDGKAGYVHLGISSERIRREILLSIRRLAIIIFFIGVAGIGVISYVVSTVTKRISKVISASQKLGRGEKNIRIEVDAEDETGKLAMAFNAMADNLEENQRRVYQAEKLAAIGRLVAGVAHEINNPIMGIRNSFKLIKDMPETPRKARKYIDLIEESLSEVEKIVKDLLTFSRQQDGTWSAFKPRDVIEKSVDFINQMAQEKGVSFHTDFCEKCQPVYGSPNEFRQVILNMFMNALDAMPGGGNITISTRCNPGTDIALIEINDEGDGIYEENVDKIFDPFFTTKDDSSGTGLGLYVCHEIITRMGGSISVAGAPGKGATFVIKLPTIRNDK